MTKVYKITTRETPDVRSDKRKPREDTKETEETGEIVCRNRRNRGCPKEPSRYPQDVLKMSLKES